MARSKWEFIVFTTRDMRTQNPLVKGSSFTCGNTKTAHGKSRASSVTTTTPQPSNGGLCELRGVATRQLSRIGRKMLAKSSPTLANPARMGHPPDYFDLPVFCCSSRSSDCLHGSGQRQTQVLRIERDTISWRAFLKPTAFRERTGIDDIKTELIQ